MSQVYGKIPDARIVSLRQERVGTSVLVVAVPLVLRAENPLDLPKVTAPTISGFGLSGAQAKRIAADNWEWELTYEGGPLLKPGGGVGAEDTAVYSLDTSDAEMPITSHPDWLKIKEKYKGTVSADGVLKFPEELPLGDGLIMTKKNPMFKVEAYLSFGAVWTKSYIANGIPGGLLKNIETMCDIPQPKWMTIPKIGKNRFWLKRIPSIRVRGSVLEITERYLLSGRGGWNKDIYRQEGNG